MTENVIWFYIFIPNTFCDNTKLKGSFDNWQIEKSITIKNLLGYHVFVIELPSNFTNYQYKIVDCNGKFITLLDRNITNDIYQNCSFRLITNSNHTNKTNSSNFIDYDENNDFDKCYYYEITDDYSKIVCENNIFSIYIKDVLLYNGKFKNGLFADYSKLYNNGYLYYQGKFINGKMNGNGTIYNSKNQKIYSGYFVDDCKNGFGIEYYKNGVIKYQGYWKKNKYDGKGVYFSDTGNVWYDGDWWNGKRFGMGVTYDDNEDIIYKGIYVNDIEKVFDFNSTDYREENSNQKNIDKTI
jgi:hypothetical protein